MSHVWPGCLSTGLNGLTLRKVAPPELPGDDWVRVRTLMAGICGSDLALLAHKMPPDSILQAYSTLPTVLGHENVGVVDQVGPAADKSWVGRRVCVDPTLCCRVRGIDPPCSRCSAGHYGACENFGSDGIGAYGLPPGTSIGYCGGAGGCFSDYFVAHESQLHPVPDGLLDEQAVLTDPIACSLHAVLRVDLSGVNQILVYGAGALGLGVISTLRAVGYQGSIDALDRAHYLKATAESMGADELLQLPAERQDRFEAVAARTGASVKRARFGNYMLSGGYDVVFDCVGSRHSINESLKWTRSRGQVAIIATGHGGKLDITPLWFTELTIVGAYGRELESFQGRRIGTYELTHEMMVSGKLEAGKLLTHTFRIEQYRQAFEVGLNKPRYEAIKVAFDLRNS